VCGSSKAELRITGDGNAQSILFRVSRGVRAIANTNGNVVRFAGPLPGYAWSRLQALLCQSSLVYTFRHWRVWLSEL